MCRFRYDAKYSDEDSPSCDEEGAENHPERKYITKDEAGKERVPQRETAPSGARMTTGREAIWNNDPRILDEMKTTVKLTSQVHTR
jgi:hypothetical protein